MKHYREQDLGEAIVAGATYAIEAELNRDRCTEEGWSRLVAVVVAIIGKSGSKKKSLRLPMKQPATCTLASEDRIYGSHTPASIALTSFRSRRSLSPINRSNSAIVATIYARCSGITPC